MTNSTIPAPSAQTLQHNSSLSIPFNDKPEIDPAKLGRALSQLLTILRGVEVTVTVTKRQTGEVSR